MSQTSQSHRRKVTRTLHCEYLLHLPKGYAKSSKNWSLILFLHGAGERGKDLNLVKKHGLAKILEGQKNFPSIVVSPQCPQDQVWDTTVLASLLTEIEANYRVDSDRIYVTGLSMDGFGTWQLALENPDRFAAIAPICGGGSFLLAHKIRDLPIWTFHCARDKVVPISRSREMVRALRKMKSPIRFTVYPEAKHDSWTQTYENPELYEWLLAQRRKS